MVACLALILCSFISICSGLVAACWLFLVHSDLGRILGLIIFCIILYCSVLQKFVSLSALCYPSLTFVFFMAFISCFSSCVIFLPLNPILHFTVYCFCKPHDSLSHVSFSWFFNLLLYSLFYSSLMPYFFEHKPFGLNFSGFLKLFFFQNGLVYLLLTLSGTLLETMLWDCGFINFI